MYGNKQIGKLSEDIQKIININELLIITEGEKSAKSENKSQPKF